MNTDPLAARQARARELERLIDEAPDEATAGPLAAELTAIMDELDNVAELHAADPERLIDRHPLPWTDQPHDGEHHVTDADGGTVYDGPDSAKLARLQRRAQDEASTR